MSARYLSGVCLGLLLSAMAHADAGASGFEPLPIVRAAPGFYAFTGEAFAQKLLTLTGFTMAQMTPEQVGALLGVSLSPKRGSSPDGDLEQVSAEGHIGPDDMFPVEYKSQTSKRQQAQLVQVYVDVPTFRLCVPFTDESLAKLKAQGWVSYASAAGKQSGAPGISVFRRQTDGAGLRVAIDGDEHCVRDINMQVLVKGVVASGRMTAPDGSADQH